MHHWYDFENRRRGTYEFPVEFHHVTEKHLRYAMPFHRHSEIEIIRVAKGSLELTAGSKKYLMYPEDSAYISGNTIHGASPQSCTYECIVCNTAALLRSNMLLNNFHRLFDGSAPIRTFYGCSDTRIREITADLFTAVRRRKDGWQLTATGCLFQFFGTVLEYGCFSEQEIPAETPNPLGADRFMNVFRLIYSKYNQTLTLEDMAAAAGMSPTYFCYLFKNFTHYTPIEYLMHYRIEQSKYLLCTENVSVSDAAIQSGFNSTAYYIKIFKKMTGSTPNQYRKQLSKTPSAPDAETCRNRYGFLP